jgi:hypothetical protein
MATGPNPSHDTPLAYRGKFVVRILGLLFIGTATGMMILGLTVWEQRLRGPEYLLYWSWCFVIVSAALFTALIDMILLRRTSQRLRRQLLHDQFASPEFVAKFGNHSPPDS